MTHQQGSLFDLIDREVDTALKQGLDPTPAEKPSQRRPHLGASAESGDIDLRFRKWHTEHPEVYRRLVEMARQLRSKGHQRYGMKSLWEVLRWHWSLGPGGASEAWRLPNDYTALFARLIMDQEPDLAGFFEIRRREGESDSEVAARRRLGSDQG